MLLTLRQAAEEVGMTKPALLKAIQRGSLSATRSENGQWQIDPAELFRVYSPATVKEPSKLAVGTDNKAGEIERLAAELKAATQENAVLREERERERRQLSGMIDDLKTDRDQWRQQATALLTHQREPSAEPTAPKAEPEPLGAFWVSIVSIVATLSALAIGAALTFHWWR